MRLPGCLHKGLIYEIIRIGALDFIYNEKDHHQEEEEDSKIMRLCFHLMNGKKKSVRVKRSTNKNKN